MILHADLIVRSMDTSLDFYCNKLGFSVVDDTVVTGPLVRAFSNNRYEAQRLVIIRVFPVGATIELVEFLPESALTENEPVHSPHPVWVSILVTDLGTHIEHLRKKGVHPCSEVFTLKMPKGGPCDLILYKDPDGNGLEFLQVAQ